MATEISYGCAFCNHTVRLIGDVLPPEFGYCCNCSRLCLPNQMYLKTFKPDGAIEGELPTAVITITSSGVSAEKEEE